MFGTNESNALMIYSLIDRVEKLEKKVFKSNRIPLTLAQQILVIKYTGLLDAITFPTKTLEAKFISILLDEDEKNTNKYLNFWATKDEKLINKVNFEVLVALFDEFNFVKALDECELILSEL